MFAGIFGVAAMSLGVLIFSRAKNINRVWVQRRRCCADSAALLG